MCRRCATTTPLASWVPAHRDTLTGYRKYKFDQVYHFASIRYLKRLGYSLKQIKLFLASRSLEHTMGQLRTQSAQLKQRWNDLMNIDSRHTAQA